MIPQEGLRYTQKMCIVYTDIILMFCNRLILSCTTAENYHESFSFKISVELVTANNSDA